MDAATKAVSVFLIVFSSQGICPKASIVTEFSAHLQIYQAAPNLNVTKRTLRNENLDDSNASGSAFL